MIKRKDLEKYLNGLLNIYEFSDYGPNGLQIEGKEQVKKIAFAVSATKNSIEKAVHAKADAMIVHHGLFWSFHGSKSLKGPFAKRVFPLVRNEINLFGYHLPLDAHPEIGNAATIAKKMGLQDLKPFGDYKGSPTGVSGTFNTEIPAQELIAKLEEILQHKVLHADAEKKIKTMGIITGGANGEWQLARRQGLDSYLTGEMSEHDWHESQEAGIHMFAGGHNATERGGVLSLMENIQNKFSNIETIFIDSENPA